MVEEVTSWVPLSRRPSDMTEKEFLITKAHETARNAYSHLHFAMEGALKRIIDLGDNRHVSPEFFHDVPGLYAAMLLDSESDKILRIARYEVYPTPPTVVEYRAYTLRERRRWAKIWGDYLLRSVSRASAQALRARALARKIAGDDPIYDSQGVQLTGAAAIAERRRLYDEDLCQTYLLRDEGNRNKIKYDSSLDLPDDFLSPDLETAKEQMMDRLDIAASRIRRWITDDPNNTGAGAQNSNMATALQLLEARRSDGRRAIRLASTIQAASVEMNTNKALVEAVGVADAPFWYEGTTRLSRKAVTYARPASGRYSHVLRADNPAGVAKGNLLGKVTLDQIWDLPDGWSVQGAHLGSVDPEDAGSALTATVGWGKDENPRSGENVFDITARNICGPSKLTLTITVPSLPPAFARASLGNLVLSSGVERTIKFDDATGGNGDVAYSMDSMPDGMTFNPSTRELKGAPSESPRGAIKYTCLATDADGNVAKQTVFISIS